MPVTFRLAHENEEALVELAKARRLSRSGYVSWLVAKHVAGKRSVASRADRAETKADNAQVLASLKGAGSVPTKAPVVVERAADEVVAVGSGDGGRENPRGACPCGSGRQWYKCGRTGKCGAGH